MPQIKTLVELKSSGYQPRSLKDEMRENLICALQTNQPVFEGIWGFDQTVIPDLERAILSRHHVLLLGLRGQAKTRLARMMVRLLDEWVPFIAGTELQDDPMAPISRQALDLLKEHGDHTTVHWLHREDRYVEKLATPDVSIADLIGDIDPIKAANEKLSFSDERVIHYGLIPRAHRSIFVINELPDLQPRIQVALFNILQEGDIQIRGFKKRLDLDIHFVFTANPEDYTNRGSIITPLKDRIDSQILTHYPEDPAISKRITLQESRIDPGVATQISVPVIVHDVLEQIAFEARESEYVDAKSGVSARLTISAYENLVSAIERRILLNKEDKGVARINDFWAVVPSITGKVELVYEGEQEGPYQVALHFMHQAIRVLFLQHFPNPEKLKKGEEKDPYGTILTWFSSGHELNLLHTDTEADFTAKLHSVAGLADLVHRLGIPSKDALSHMELVLHGLAEFQHIGKDLIGNDLYFKDDLAGALLDLDDDPE
ncbi:MAG: sigma 54-interacting transcriptional regulator [Saprospiraceae bacterium]|nr:sigma 54-interacting transcriptional regulator [Saprospiraceae bacterium]